ncbi:hypothetical protein [Ktedonobacter racemifer]|uniref:Uncharacterized protein n=1 Tax=Ktedonobacter racemifer DSM 44963 TaxID=485913 RepID=D6TKY4_KTERA|nr:hypothetical protein [Ktedonobacter racemifer]EFH86434.1 hypothetical protein Krac_7732 [Ktedonobacter racemifer DSM 44963]
MKSKGMLWASFFLALLLIGGSIIWIAQDQNNRHQHDLSVQATETAVRNGTKTAVAYASTGTAVYQATANAVPNAFSTPFIATSIFHEDLSQVNSNWEQSGCDFQDGSYQIALDQSYYKGCPRSGTSGFNNVAYQVVFRDMQSHGDGGVGIAYNVQEEGVVSAGDMFLIDKDGNYRIVTVNILSSFKQSGKVSFPITFPLYIGMKVQSDQCRFYVNRHEVKLDTPIRDCQSSFGVAAFGTSTAAHFIEDDLWRLPSQ